MIFKTTATLFQPAIRSRAISCLSRRELAVYSQPSIHRTKVSLSSCRNLTATPFILLHRSPITPPTSTLLSSYSKKSPFSTSSLSRAASEVAGKPASENIPHAAQNAKEEASAVASTIAKGIAGKGGKGDFDAAAVTRTQEATGPDHNLGDSFVRVMFFCALRS